MNDDLYKLFDNIVIKYDLKNDQEINQMIHKIIELQNDFKKQESFYEEYINELQQMISRYREIISKRCPEELI